jgi:hypothetical protein
MSVATARSPIVSPRATLIGRDGSAVGLSGDGAEATVPVGEYRIGTLTVALDDPSGGPRWSFVFSDNGGKPEQRWYKVEKGATAAIDPIGTLEMKTGLDDGSKAPKPGDEVKLQPQLYTGDGLLINTCFRGSLASPAAYDGPGAEIVLAATDGQPLARARSGFA